MGKLPLLAACLAATALLPAQTPSHPLDPLPGTASAPGGLSLSPFNTPTLTPGELELLKLEGQFSDDVARRGGPAFASWFADDGITLQNGQPPVRGRAAIAAAATWDPKDYQLTWYAEGAQMQPGGTSGFTWGHYDATAKDAHGQPVNTSGRFITVWKRVNNTWKVALDASANDVPANDCCTLPKP